MAREVLLAESMDLADENWGHFSYELPEYQQARVEHIFVGLNRTPPYRLVSRLMEPQHRGKSYPSFATVFIGRHADIGTWFHELGHLVYTRLTPDEKTSFAGCVHGHGSILESDGTQTCVDPASRADVLLPPGKYLEIEGRLVGLDHSGTDEEAVNDECWAAIFGLGFTNVPVPVAVADAFETIIERVKQGSH